MLPLVALLLRLQTFHVEIEADGKSISTKANLVVVANGPVTGAALRLAPDAKLNDHRLNLAIYHMHWWNMVKYFYSLFVHKKVDRRRIRMIDAKEVKVTADQEVLVHADATLFGSAPVKYVIKPLCLQVICGFPESAQKASFVAKTFINP